MKLFTIDTGNFMADGGALFGVIPKMMWQKQYPVDADNYCNMKMRCLLVDTGERRILIDTGAGDKQSDKFFSFSRLNGDATLEKSLNKAGYAYDDITDVILTHLHWDHCGGCVYYDADGTEQVRFKNATHWVSKLQWDNYLKPNIREGAVYFPENMMPIYEAGLIKTIESDGAIMPHIDIEIYDGHTVGNMVPIIHTPNGSIAFMGDVMPVLACMQPLWVPAYDTQPLISIDDKTIFLRKALDKEMTLFFEHDLEVECCSLKQNGKSITYEHTFKLEEFMACKV